MPFCCVEWVLLLVELRLQQTWWGLLALLGDLALGAEGEHAASVHVLVSMNGTQRHAATAGAAQRCLRCPLHSCAFGFRATF